MIALAKFKGHISSIKNMLPNDLPNPGTQHTTPKHIILKTNTEGKYKQILPYKSTPNPPNFSFKKQTKGKKYKKNATQSPNILSKTGLE